jgi:hypothetical protein
LCPSLFMSEEVKYLTFVHRRRDSYVLWQTHILLKPNFTLFFSSYVHIAGLSFRVCTNFSPLLALPTKARILCLDSL